MRRAFVVGSNARVVRPVRLVAGAAAGVLLVGGCGSSGLADVATESPRAVASSATTPRQVVPALAGGESVMFANDPPQVILLGAGAGHVVAIRGAERGSDLLDISTPGKPKALAHLVGAVSVPSVGTDAAGVPVVVFSPCAASGPGRPTPCNLDVVDLETGKRSALAATRGARLGDMDRGRVVVVRRSKLGQDRFAVSTGVDSTTFKALSLTTIERHRSTKAYPENRGAAVTGIDFADGRLAATLSFSDAHGGGSQLLVRTLAGRWNELAQTNYGQLDGVSRELQAPTVTATGVRAFDDGGAEANPSVSRWSPTGKPLGRIGVKRKFGIDESAAINGDLLITAGNQDTSLHGDGPVLQSGPYSLG